MRTRKEIEGEFYDGHLARIYVPKDIELLLDIRDLLTNKEDRV